jgi:hypothetical protein
MAFDGSHAEFYRQQARRLRARAAAYTVPDIKQEFERLADQWERLADDVARGLSRP